MKSSVWQCSTVEFAKKEEEEEDLFKNFLVMVNHNK